VGKIRDISGFHSSLDMLRQEELAQTGFSADGQAVIRDLETMFKALTPEAIEAPAKRAAQRETQALANRATKPVASFTKALRDLAGMTKAATSRKPTRVASIEVRDPAAAPAAIVAKSFDALNHDANLNADQRGRLMLGLSTIAGKVFAKADGVSGRLDQVRAAIALLDRAKAEHKIAEIDPLVEQIREAVRRGETEPSDLLTIESKLHEIRRHLENHLEEQADNGEAN